MSVYEHMYIIQVWLYILYIYILTYIFTCKAAVEIRVSGSFRLLREVSEMAGVHEVVMGSQGLYPGLLRPQTSSP